MKSDNLASLSEFSKGLDRLAKKEVPKMIKDAQIYIGWRLYESVKLLNPVLTGHSRHNWVPTVGGQADIVYQGVFGGTTTGEPLVGKEIMAWQPVVAKIKVSMLGETIWITNNVPYILRLEHGYSQKAPVGMALVSLQTVLEDVNSRGVLRYVSGE